MLAVARIGLSALLVSSEAGFDVGGSTEDLPEPRYSRRFARDGGAMRERVWSPEAAEVAGGAAR